MTDLEKAVLEWLPEAWTERRCPPATPELGFRLLESMLAKRPQDIVLHTFLDDDERLLYAVRIGWIADDYSDTDLLTAIIKAAAALAEKEQP